MKPRVWMNRKTAGLWIYIEDDVWGKYLLDENGNGWLDVMRADFEDLGEL